MLIVYTFIGTLPSYCIETVHQLRLFYKGVVYFIVDDYDSPHVKVMESKYNITIVRYDSVVDTNFLNLVENVKTKFLVLPGLKERAHLFSRAFERFYVLHNLMLQKDLTDVFYLELDNLIYNDPLVWLEGFSTKEMAYMFDNYNRASSGICYIKSPPILKEFMECSSDFIKNSNDFMTEMTTLYTFWERNKDRVQLLPIYWTHSPYPSQTYETFPLYNSIFDALSMGVYLGGVDPYHSNGIVTKGWKATWGLIDYTAYKYEWKADEQMRKIPHVWTGEVWLRINNLHVHSKDLQSCLSLPLEV
jgi:hypothetical protein